jgi:MFS family permease
MVVPSRAAVRRIAAARLISLTGGAAAFMALNFTIYQRTHSPTWVAAALFLTFGTTGFASAFAGALGDRFDRQRVMIASDLAGAVFFFAMAFAHAPWLLLTFAFLSAVAEAPFLSASAAAIPNMVGEEELGWANGLVSLGRNAGILVGPLLGGVLVSTIGGGAVFAVNAVTFLASAALVASVKARFNEDRVGSDEHRGLRAGFRFLKGDRILRTLTLAWLAIVLGLGMTMVADVPLVDLFRAGSLGYGVLIACWGGGSIAGSLLGRFLKPRNEAVAVLVSLAVVAGTSVVVGFSPWFALVLGAIFAMGVGDGVSLVAEQNIMQRRTPDAVRSRVLGAFDSVVHIGMAFSFVAAGPAVAWLGARGIYVVGGGIAALGVFLALPILGARRVTMASDEAGLGPPSPSLPREEQPDPASLLIP